MTKTPRDVRFGALLEADAHRPQDVVALAELMDGLGLDVVSLADHPYWPERLDTVTLLAAIIARTKRITVMPNLLNLPLRPPPMVARTAATMDILGGGRFELGLGTGAQQMWNSIRAEGGPERNAGQSIEALQEAVRIIRALWSSEDDVEYEGKHYRLGGAKPGPKPAHPISIWLGGYRPRMLSLVGTIGDGWIASSPYLPPEALPAANRTIDKAALAAGRDLKSVHRGYNIEGRFSNGPGFLQGPAEVWAEQLAELAFTERINTFFLYRVGTADILRRFAEEVVPATRALLAAT